jgi:hypothetical protein
MTITKIDNCLKREGGRLALAVSEFLIKLFSQPWKADAILTEDLCRRHKPQRIRGFWHPDFWEGGARCSTDSVTLHV